MQPSKQAHSIKGISTALQNFACFFPKLSCCNGYLFYRLCLDVILHDPIIIRWIQNADYFVIQLLCCYRHKIVTIKTQNNQLNSILESHLLFTSCEIKCFVQTAEKSLHHRNTYKHPGTENFLAAVTSFFPFSFQFKCIAFRMCYCLRSV